MTDDEIAGARAPRQRRSGAAVAENDGGTGVADARETLIAELREIARLAEIKGQYGAALRALSAIARLQGMLPSRSARPARKQAPRREPTLLEAADAIANSVTP
jgi:hypothetical protein